MKPYPRNNIQYNIKTPMYKTQTVDINSRYSIYRQTINYPSKALEVKLINSISENRTYQGYYYTTKQKETLYQISKQFYGNEIFWWIIAKANHFKDDKTIILDPGITISIPAFTELTNDGGYFTL